MDDTYRILAHGRTVSNDTWQTGLNNNDLIMTVKGKVHAHGRRFLAALFWAGLFYFFRDTRPKSQAMCLIL